MTTTRFARGLGLALAIALASCGGGGDDAPAGPTVVLDSPPTVTAEAVQTGTFAPVVLRGHMAGDVQALAGKTIYVVVEDPSGIFSTRADLRYSATVRNGVELSLHGRPQLQAGRKTGTFRVLVCADSACTTPYAGSPLTLNYDINVLPGLSLETELLQTTAVFGDASVRRSVAVTVPKYMMDLHIDYAFDEFQVRPGAFVVVGQRILSDSSASIDLGFRPLTAGTYRRELIVRGSATVPGGDRVHFSKTLRIEHTITPNPAVPIVFEPASITRTHTLNDPITQHFGWNVLRNDVNATVREIGIEYVSHPPSAAGHSLVNSWLYGQVTSPCLGSNGITTCLPAGRYEARVVYEHTLNGVVSTVYYPIVLNIVP